MTSRSHNTALALAAPVAPEEALRTMLTTLIQQTIEREFTQFVGAEKSVRSATRTGLRNGYRTRQLTTRVGSVELRIPRDRAGEFQPTLFARYQRSEQALVLALAEMYVQGVSTRKVSTMVETLCGATVSASTVSAITKTLDAGLTAWRERPLHGKTYPYLIIDAHVERVRREGAVRNKAVLWVIGIDADGYREHLGVWLGASESAASWRAVCEDLIARGLHGVRYVVSDEHPGMVQSMQRFFRDSVHQRCQVHYLRNAFSKISSPAMRERVAEDLRHVWRSTTRAEAGARLTRLLLKIRPHHAALADWLEETAHDTLGVYALCEADGRKRLATTNSIEHDHMAVRRRTRVIRVFPNEASFLRLASALASERNEQWMVRRYVTAQKDLKQPLVKIAA
jgi:putative transposase